MTSVLSPHDGNPNSSSAFFSSAAAAFKSKPKSDAAKPKAAVVKSEATAEKLKAQPKAVNAPKMGRWRNRVRITNQSELRSLNRRKSGDRYERINLETRIKICLQETLCSDTMLNVKTSREITGQNLPQPFLGYNIRASLQENIYKAHV